MEIEKISPNNTKQLNKKINVFPYLLVGIVVLVSVGTFFTVITGSAVSAKEIRIPTSEISETAQFYKYMTKGTSVEYFVVKSADGDIKTGFNACDVCFKAKKGYRQEGDYMVCNNCGNRYPIIGLGTENQNPGGCWPGHLKSYVDGNEIVIKESDLKEGKWRFE